jgi:hypothetical protein
MSDTANGPPFVGLAQPIPLKPKLKPRGRLGGGEKRSKIRSFPLSIERNSVPSVVAQQPFKRSPSLNDNVGFEASRH